MKHVSVTLQELVDEVGRRVRAAVHRAAPVDRPGDVDLLPETFERLTMVHDDVDALRRDAAGPVPAASYQQNPASAIGVGDPYEREIWIPCAHCDDPWCDVHGKHAFACPCPPIEEWGDDA